MKPFFILLLSILTTMPAAYGEGKRWDYHPDHLSTTHNIVHAQNKSPLLNEVETRFESLWRENQFLKSKKHVGCTFVVDPDGRISEVEPLHLGGTVDKKSQTALVELVKKIGPSQSSNYSSSDKVSEKFQLRLLQFPYYRLSKKIKQMQLKGA